MIDLRGMALLKMMTCGAVLIALIAGCSSKGSGPGPDSASTDVSVPAASTPPTSSGPSGSRAPSTATSTTATSSTSTKSASGPGCPLTASDVSRVVGGRVVAAPDLVTSVVTPDVRGRLDVSCGFSANGQLTVPVVIAIGSDDPAAHQVALHDLGSDPRPVAGIGDAAYTNEDGELVVDAGDTSYFITVGLADTSGQGAAAKAIARMLVG